MGLRQRQGRNNCGALHYILLVNIPLQKRIIFANIHVCIYISFTTVIILSSSCSFSRQRMYVQYDKRKEIDGRTWYLAPGTWWCCLESGTWHLVPRTVWMEHKDGGWHLEVPGTRYLVPAGFFGTWYGTIGHKLPGSSTWYQGTRYQYHPGGMHMIQGWCTRALCTATNVLSMMRTTK